MKSLKSLLVLPLLLSLIGCEGQNEFREDVIMAGGLYVKADTLNLGKRIYTEYCMACHGVDGDGKGVASLGMQTPARNFKLGIMKFGDVVSGELPHDEIIKLHIKRGLSGSAMLPWDLSDTQLDAVVQYIKTFAPDTWIGKDKELGAKIEITKDPFGIARKSSAIEQGKTVYHITANCQSCHRAYVSHQELSNLNEKVYGDAITDFDPLLYQVKPQETEHAYVNIPPDFTWHEMRSVYSVEDMYLRLAAGVGGTAMPAWKDTLSDQEIWAVAYYVMSLQEYKNSPDRAQFLKAIQGPKK